MPDTVLVTGGSGFIASHTIRALLDRGYAVRATVRSRDKGAALKDQFPEIETAQADLGADAGWREAAAGAAFVLHMASPFPMNVPDDRDTLIRPAVEGTKRVLRAAAEAGARRAVVTSSVAAIAYGQPGRDAAFTEDDWTDPENPKVEAYPASKTLAERAAWATASEAQLPLAVINPVLVTGPLLSGTHGASVGLIKRMLSGGFPALPRTGFGVVDVRDVATAHVEAMERDEAAGERFILSERWMWLTEVAEVLKERFPDQRVSTRQAPDFMVKLAAIFDKSARQVSGDLGTRRAADGSKAARMLGIDYLPAPRSIAATGESLIDQGLV